jgi:hypothetical protein
MVDLSFLDARREIHPLSEKVVEALSFPCAESGGKGGILTVISRVVFMK